MPWQHPVVPAVPPPVEIVARRWSAVTSLVISLITTGLVSTLWGGILVRMWTVGPETPLEMIVGQPVLAFAAIAISVLLVLLCDWPARISIVLWRTVWRRGPTISLGFTGLFDRRVMKRPLPWHRIERISLTEIHMRGGPHLWVVIRTAGTDRSLKRRNGLRDWLFSLFDVWHRQFWLDVHGLPLKTDQLLAQVEACARLHGCPAMKG